MYSIEKEVMVMAKEVSNKVLSILIGVAVVVSVIGLYIGAPGRLTGFSTDNATGYGVANVIADLQLSVLDDAIYLGELRQSEENDSDQALDWWIFQNTGRTRLDLYYFASNNLFDYDCGGEDAANQSGAAGACFRMLVKNKSDSGAAVNGTYDSAYTTVVVNAEEQLIEDLSESHNFTVGLNVTVPVYETAGTKNQSIEIVGYQHN